MVPGGGLEVRRVRGSAGPNRPLWSNLVLLIKTDGSTITTIDLIFGTARPSLGGQQPFNIKVLDSRAAAAAWLHLDSVI